METTSWAPAVHQAVCSLGVSVHFMDLKGLVVLQRGEMGEEPFRLTSLCRCVVSGGFGNCEHIDRQARVWTIAYASSSAMQQ